MEQINSFIAEKFYYGFLGVLAVYIIMRMRNKHSILKRKVVFTLAIGVFLAYTAAILPLQGVMPHGATLIIFAAIIAGEFYLIRKQWIFKRNCVVCGTQLDWNTTLMDDRNTCADCLIKAEDAEDGGNREDAAEGDE